MKVMLLAAGRGERMRPLTDHTPKPLLQVAGVPLLEHHIRRLVAAGFLELVVNVSYCAEQIIDYFGDGSAWGASIAWSREPRALETAGGIINAMPLLGSDPFLVINGDVWTDFPLAGLREIALLNARSAHLVLVDNPEHHSRGDFVLAKNGRLELLSADLQGLTYGGLGIYSTGFFDGVEAGKLPLRPLLLRAIEQNCLAGEYYAGQWVDVGTPERLSQLNAELA